MEWNNINVIFPPENKLVLVCYKEANRNEVGAFYWVPVGSKRIWVGNIRENNISHWADIGPLPVTKWIDKSDRFNLSPIETRFEILDL